MGKQKVMQTRKTSINESGCSHGQSFPHSSLSNSNIRLPAATDAAWARSQFRLTLIRRNTGIAWMREGSLPDTSKTIHRIIFDEHRFCFAHPNNSLDCSDLRSIPDFTAQDRICPVDRFCRVKQ